MREKDSMRLVLWRWLRSNHPPYLELPRWLLLIRALLFPIDFFFWRVGKSRGYQWESEMWLIGGHRWSGEFFHVLSNSNGGVYRIWMDGNRVMFQRLPRDC